MKKVAVLIMAFAGLVFILLSSPEVFRSYKLKLTGISTQGTVLGKVRAGRKSELDQVTVVFTTKEGQQVTATAFRRNYSEPGNKVKLWYDGSDPQKITFGDAAGYNMRAVLLGGLLIAFGLYFFIKYSSEDLSARKILASGMKISAEVTLTQDERYNIGKNNPWMINARWTDSRTSREYHFKSKLYTIDPTPYLNGRSHIDVYINPDDPSKYHMDVSFMPKGNYTIG